jgi:hypothetical protein
LALDFELAPHVAAAKTASNPHQRSRVSRYDNQQHQQTF